MCICRSRVGFTLIEVLVVVAIIALLVAILLPSLRRARESAKSAMCKTSQRQLVLGVHQYVTENKRLPGTQSLFYEQASVFGNPAMYPPPYPASEKSTNWVWDGSASNVGYTGRSDPRYIRDCPNRGTIFRYVRNEKVYLCASDHVGDADQTPAGGGGDGRNSYSMNAYLGYVNPDRMTGTARAYKPPNYNELLYTVGPKRFHPSEMFLFVEEHPYYFKQTFLEGNFNYQDKISTRHALSSSPDVSKASSNKPLAAKSSSGRSNVAYVDGHVEFPTFNGLADAATLFHKVGMPVDLAPVGIDSSGVYSSFLQEFMYNMGSKPPW